MQVQQPSKLREGEHGWNLMQCKHLQPTVCSKISETTYHLLEFLSLNVNLFRQLFVKPLVLIKFAPILLSLLLFDLIDLLHDKAGMFSYIIVGLSMQRECFIYQV